jgi:DNA-binding GntR family transcriptional regulator
MDARARVRQQLPDEVASYVRELILSGAVEPGEFLRMEPIAEAVGVSNTPVREGLLTLRSEGLVHLVPRRGFVVSSFSRQDVRDIFWAQGQLAGELAARAAKLITDEQMAMLESIDAEFQVAADKGDTVRVTDLGVQFHVIVNRSAQSHRLALLLDSIVNQLPSHFYAGIEGKVASSREVHPALIDALKRHHVRKARELMQDHVEGSAAHLIGMLEERGMWA